MAFLLCSKCSRVGKVVIIEDGFGFIKDPEKEDESETVRRFTIANTNKFQVQVISYGATITSVKCADRNGRIHDVVLGFDDLEGYIKNQSSYFGSTIGRVANLLSNGVFILEGREYEVTMNAGYNHRHGGFKGFDQVMWKSYINNGKVVFTYLSKDGEEGYPGDVLTQVAYSISDDNDLKIEKTSMSTKPTPINLTNHAYFNLAGHCAGSKALNDHVVTINADRLLALSEDLTPSGEIRKVGGTVYDLRTPKKLGTVIHDVPGDGYDNTFCINGKEDGLRFAARVYHPPSGRALEVYTNQPGLQFYNSLHFPEPDAPIKNPEDYISEFPNAEMEEEVQPEIGDLPESPNVEMEKEVLHEISGKDGVLYNKHGGFCLESLNYPDAVNHRRFPDSILRPGEIYSHTVIYRFSIQK